MLDLNQFLFLFDVQKLDYTVITGLILQAKRHFRQL